MDDLMKEAYTYYIGDGYTFDRMKALEIYEKIALENNVEAIYYCGMCLDYLGKRNKENYQKAFKYFEKAFEFNHVKATEMYFEYKKKGY